MRWCDEFLDFCSMHGECHPGERKLARAFLERIERGEVGSSRKERNGHGGFACISGAAGGFCHDGFAGDWLSALLTELVPEWMGAEGRPEPCVCVCEPGLLVSGVGCGRLYDSLGVGGESAGACSGAGDRCAGAGGVERDAVRGKQPSGMRWRWWRLGRWGCWRGGWYGCGCWEFYELCHFS